MSEIRVNILDGERAIHGDLHGSFGDALIASLMAEPETIDEFTIALSRFIKPTETWTPLKNFRRGENFEPYDAGIMIIDLAARVIGFESTYSYPEHEGSVRIESEFGDFAEDDGFVYIPYKIPGDWQIVTGIPEFKGLSLARRRDRSSFKTFDPRSVLYGRALIDYLFDSLKMAENLDAEDLFTEIHAKWLITPRDDLLGKTPREVLYERRKRIDFDLHTRSLQYSFTKLCPKPIPPESFAYRFAGFGTNEIVVYYDLVRELLYEAVERNKKNSIWDREKEIGRLEQFRDRWFESENSEFGRTPASIVESERKRLNLTMSAEGCSVDDDCPICLAMYEDFDTPMFWYLDGCNMDDRFEFSFYDTPEEWEEEQRRYEEYSREFNEKWRTEGRDGDEFLNSGEEPF